MTTKVINNLPELTILDPRDEAWMAVISQNPSAHVFHHPYWMEVIQETYGYHPFIAAFVDGDGNILAGCPIMEIRNFASHPKWISLPFSDYCQILCANDSLREPLVNRINELAIDNQIGILEFRCDASTPLNKSSKHVLTSTELFPDLKIIEGKIKSNDSRKLRAAISRGVETCSDTTTEFMDIYYQLHIQTRHRLGLPVQPKKFFNLIQQKMLQNGLGFVTLAKVDGHYVAGSVFLSWRQTLVYKFNATSQLGRDLYANDAIIWDAIRYGCANDYRLLDWGRTDLDDDGLRRFKNRWASTEVPLVYSNNTYSSHGKMITFAVKWIRPILQKTPQWVNRLAGEALYRYLG